MNVALGPWVDDGLMKHLHNLRVDEAGSLIQSRDIGDGQAWAIVRRTGPRLLGEDVLVHRLYSIPSDEMT